MFSSAMQRLHDKRNGVGEDGDDAGFTLIELMVVLLILAILLAIAIPTFLGVTKSANDRAAQSNLNTAFTNAKAYFQTNGQSYGTAGAAALVSALSTAEPSLSFVVGVGGSAPTGNSTSQNMVSVATTTDGYGLILAIQAKSTNNCWFILDNSSTAAETAAPFTNVPAANQAAGTWYAESKNATTCNASAPPTVAGNYAASGAGFPNL